MYIKKGYRKPKATPIDTSTHCHYGCGQLALFQFDNEKLCCSQSYNSCPAKRKTFSDRTDHKETAAKSLATRVATGVTKTSREKTKNTMIERGLYEVLRQKMQLHWKNNPHENNPRCPLVPYKNTQLKFQGSHEYDFLESLENANGIDWLIGNVKRGPSVWYTDHNDTKRLYISDFIVDNTIYEIKSAWTWNKKGTDINLEKMNRAKLDECIKQGYEVVLVLDRKEMKYD